MLLLWLSALLLLAAFAVSFSICNIVQHLSKTTLPIGFAVVVVVLDFVVVTVVD